MKDTCRTAAEALLSADALLIGAGAGMGVDSGLPDFRGPEGFWKAYPALTGRRFSDMSTPHWFQTDPELAWGFFGHRLNLYRAAIPHDGFQILARWSERMSLGSFVFTSNVDGQFQKAGFSDDRIVECHGSIHYLQCARGCHHDIWSADGVTLDVDAATIRTSSQLPKCPKCRMLARPNILMFNDFAWIDERSEQQLKVYNRWLRRVSSSRLVTVELGAGLAVPTVRIECESHGKLIRVNPRDPDVPAGGISVNVGALAALRAIDEEMQRIQSK